ncbi:hypothetical protein O6H91_20G015400 [Diphasiastrum complanatum]|uniref:Uncharacterized protein n=1 Tax=Diphasiastrum complanatum TaxID=34168 RepID=A0ACC2ANE4_DIPCM|nr:hypothetical protein O6H91_20G015400 [Diphasiastrum complanatum]
MGACISKEKQQVHEERSCRKSFNNVGSARSPIIPSSHQLSSLFLETPSISAAIASDLGALDCSPPASKTLLSKGECQSKARKELCTPNSLQNRIDQNEFDLFFINEDGGVELYEQYLDQPGFFFLEEKGEGDDEGSSYIQAPTNSPNRIWQKQFFLQGSTSHHGRDGEASAKYSDDATKTTSAMVHELATQALKDHHVLAAASIFRKSGSSTSQELAMINTQFRELNDYKEKRHTFLRSSAADGRGNASFHNMKRSSDRSPASSWVSYVQNSAVPEVPFSFGAGPYKAARAMSAEIDRPRNSCCSISHPLCDAPSKPMSFREQEKRNPVRKKLGFFLLSNPLRSTAAISTKISARVESQFHHLSADGWEDDADNSDSSSDLFEIDSVTTYLSSARSSRNSYVDKDQIDNSCSLADNTYWLFDKEGHAKRQKHEQML